MHGPRREEKQTAMNQIISYSNFWNYIDLELSNLMSSYFIARKLKVKKISLVITKKHKQRKKIKIHKKETSIYIVMLINYLTKTTRNACRIVSKNKFRTKKVLSQKSGMDTPANALSGCQKSCWPIDWLGLIEKNSSLLAYLTTFASCSVLRTNMVQIMESQT